MQDLTGIEDISVCRDVLQRHAWDLEVSVQDQLNMREGRPSVFASDLHTPAVVNDHSAQHVFFSPPRDNSPHSIGGLFKYIMSLVFQMCYNTIANILQFTFRILQPDHRRCKYGSSIKSGLFLIYDFKSDFRACHSTAGLMSSFLQTEVKIIQPIWGWCLVSQFYFSN